MPPWLRCGVKLNIPPFLRGKTQQRLFETRRIASLRIHVEQCMEHIKNFHIRLPQGSNLILRDVHIFPFLTWVNSLYCYIFVSAPKYRDIVLASFDIDVDLGGACNNIMNLINVF